MSQINQIDNQWYNFFFFAVPPVISNVHPSHNLTVRKGSTVKLVCNATGFPKPEINWQREVSFTTYTYYIGGSLSFSPGKRQKERYTKIVFPKKSAFWDDTQGFSFSDGHHQAEKQ